jgi:N-methylhydantoinase A
VEWGTEAATRTLVAYGGAAPLHAAALADKLKIDRIVIPTGAGVGSAIGFLLAPVSYEVVRSRYQRLSAFDPDSANAAMAEMQAEAAEVVSAAAPEGRWREGRRAYMRYAGQGYEIAVPVPVETLTEAHAAELHHAFEAEYQRLYGRLIPHLDVEILSWTLTLVAREPAPPEALGAPTPRPREPAASCALFDPRQGEPVQAGLYRRDALQPGDRAAGPALVVEDQTTTVVAAGFDVTVDPRGNLVLERQTAADGGGS